MAWDNRAVAHRADCRHYAERSIPDTSEKIQRCRLDAANLDPFACPEGCIFFEERTISDTGWTIDPRRPRDT
jgi:hypothetical protein